MFHIIFHFSKEKSLFFRIANNQFWKKAVTNDRLFSRTFADTMHKYFRFALKSHLVLKKATDKNCMHCLDAVQTLLSGRFSACATTSAIREFHKICINP